MSAFSNALPSTFIPGYHNEEAVKRMQYSKLGKVSVSRLALGGSAFGDVFGRKSLEDYADVVETAIKNGINYIDVAPYYGSTLAEQNLGKIFRERNIPREAYYISSKVGRYGGNPQFDFSAARVKKSVHESLTRLVLNSLDFLLAHDVEFASMDTLIKETLPTLKELKDTGIVKYIGFSCYPLSKFQKVIEESPVMVDFVLTYYHYCLFNNSLEDYMPYFNVKGISVINASPFGMGLLTNNGPLVWHPASDVIKTACKKAAEYTRSKNINIAKLALRFAYNFENVLTTVASSYSMDYLLDNIEAVTSPLAAEEEQILEDVLKLFSESLTPKTW